MRFSPPVAPYRGTRGIDAFGGGGYNAPRSKGGKSYGHRGLDFIAHPGDDIVMPFNGILTAPGLAYPDSELGSVHIDGTGDFLGFRAKILYALQLSAEENASVPAGQIIARAQNVAAYHEHKAGDGRKMTNHVHFELRKDGALVDPTPYFLVS